MATRNLSIPQKTRAGQNQRDGKQLRAEEGASISTDALP
jgi:hypothetical protein